MPTTCADAKRRGRAGGFAGVIEKTQVDPTSASKMVDEFRNFKSSAAPARFLFFTDGSWVDFVPRVFDTLRDGFLAGRTTMEVPIAGAPHLFDFLRMTRVNMETRESRSIAWIDAEGRCFFPKSATDEQINCPKLAIDIRIVRGSPSAVTSSTCSSDETLAAGGALDANHQEHSDESAEASSVATLDGARWHGVQVVADGDRYFKIIEKLFLAGIRRSVPDAVVSSISKCSHAGALGSSRLKAFQTQARITKEVRGDANLKFGCFGTSARELGTVLAHGFGWTNEKLLGSDAHGVGVHLAAPCFPYSSALLSEADGNGERHVVLCRVIMGKPEKVAKGSLQYHPSSGEFDSGVDDLAKPRWYVVWSTHMNTHIIPEYIVSFKCSKQAQGDQGLKCPSYRARRTSPPTSPSFLKVLEELQRCLPASVLPALEMAHSRYKEGKIQRDAFIRYLRGIAGDKLLGSIIRKIRG